MCAILDANGMYRSVNMSAIEGPDFCQPKIRNFANICKFHQPTCTRCYSCCCSTKRDPTAHLRRPAVQYGPGQLYAVRRLMIRAAQKRHSRLIGLPVVNSPVRPQLCRLPRRPCLVPRSDRSTAEEYHPSGAADWCLPCAVGYKLVFTSSLAKSAELPGYKLDVAILTETACQEPSIIIKDCSSSTEVLIGGDDRFPGLRRSFWENYVRRHLALYRLGR